MVEDLVCVTQVRVDDCRAFTCFKGARRTWLTIRSLRQYRRKKGRPLDRADKMLLVFSLRKMKLPNNRANPGTRVIEGLRKISVADPQWWCEGGENEINPDTLNMLDQPRSLLAQRFGSVTAGLKRLGISKDEALACGFIALDVEDAIQLRRLWLLQLMSSRAEAKSRPPIDWPPSSQGDSAPRWYL